MMLDIVAITIAAFALLISFLSMHISRGNQDLQIRNMISAARRELSTRAKELNDNRNDKFLKQNFLTAEEDLRNAYETACSSYLDRKIDRDRFKRTYSVEIRNLVENANQKVHYNSIDSKYKATIKVYSKWNNLEK